MQDKEVLKQLKIAIDRQGLAFITWQLGYSSSNTIVKWFKNKRIPKWRVGTVVDKLKTIEKGALNVS